MIFILSETGDLSTDKVIEWLIGSEQYVEIERVNECDSIKINKLGLDNPGIIDIQLLNPITNKCFAINLVSFFWFRRGSMYKNIPLITECTVLNEKFLKFLNWEWKICFNFVLDTLQTKASLGNFFKSSVNKLKSLKIAANCGFKIPETIISENFQNTCAITGPGDYITKPISETMTIADDDSYIDLKTTTFNRSATSFFPSLCQKRIDKWIELRVFISYDQIYSMAVFSQGNSKTEVDYRNYDRNKLNRFVPFQLPCEIKRRVLNFMGEAGLDTGSMDLILTPGKEYVFLEINPGGNIEMVSEPCNYYIEKRIAEQILERMSS